MRQDFGRDHCCQQEKVQQQFKADRVFTYVLKWHVCSRTTSVLIRVCCSRPTRRMEGSIEFSSLPLPPVPSVSSSSI